MTGSCAANARPGQKALAEMLPSRRGAMTAAAADAVIGARTHPQPKLQRKVRRKLRKATTVFMLLRRVRTAALRRSAWASGLFPPRRKVRTVPCEYDDTCMSRCLITAAVQRAVRIRIFVRYPCSCS